MLSCAGSHTKPLRISPQTINAVREARASGGRRVRLSPGAAPLALMFAALGGLTYYQVSAAMEHTRSVARPHGLLGPAVNDFLRDVGDRA